jgi:ubiquinone biosynthesis protein UbiJ
MWPMALSFVESLINRTIRFDPRTEKRLALLSGKSLLLEVTDLKLNILILFTEEGIRLQTQKKEEHGFHSTEVENIKGGNIQEKSTQEKSTQNSADVSVKAPSRALVAFILSKEIKDAINRGLVIEGDLELASEIQHFVLDLDIDWEEILSQYTGDMLAHQVFNIYHKIKGKKQDIRNSLLHSAGNFLQEEIQLLPTAVEMQHFNQSVDSLRDEVDRLEAKILLFLKNQSNSTGAGKS